ncbi:LuxR C-terminal-related transcriptional regulator [Streptomyces sp. NBC_00564]|uniref:helix-turn-helix transcriptional regulator n=1 Tax=Streptomyces sp. NBC_00564 TaxID=2903663 RepID=UPI00352E54DB
MGSLANGPTGGVQQVGSTMPEPMKRSVLRTPATRRVVASNILRGRTEEMTTALHMLRATSRCGRGQVLIITGEPGLGKSALAQTIVASADAMHFRTGVGSADAIGHLSPGNPLLFSMRHASRPLLTGEEMAGLVTQIREPLMLLESVASRLEAAAEAGPVLLMLDDLERADQITRFLLRNLPLRLASFPIIWLFVGRTVHGSVLNDVSTLRDYRAAQIAVERLDLHPLSSQAILDVAHDRLGVRPPETSVELLMRVDGSPFLAVQVIDALVGSRWKVDESGEPSTTAQASIPRPVARALHSTLLGLSPQAVDTIQVLAVLSHPASPRDVQDLTGFSPRENAGVLDEAIDAGVLFQSNGRIAFRYPLIREAVFADLAEQTRRALHRRCARHLAAADADSALVAAHAQEGIEPGETECAALVMQSAADLVATEPQAAGELAITAFRALRPSDGTYPALGERCVRILGLAQRCEDAVTVGDLILAHLDSGDTSGRIEFALAQALWLAGRWELSSARCASALSRSDLTAAVRARLGALQALLGTRLRGARVTRQPAEAALREARRLKDYEARVTALHALAEVARNSADHAGSLSYIRQLQVEAPPSFFAQEVMALQHLDRYRDAETLLRHARSESGEHPASLAPALMHAQIWQDYDLGRLNEAETGARTLLALARENGLRLYELEATSVVSMVALNRGRLEVARNELAVNGSEVTGDEHMHPSLVLLTRSWLSAAEGEPSAAIRLLSPLMRTAHTECDPWPWKPGWLPILARIGVADEDTAFLERVQLLAEIGAARNPGVTSFQGTAWHIEGLIRRDGALLRRAVDVLATGPRPLLLAGAREDLGKHLLSEQEQSEAIAQLDKAWQAYRQADAIGSMLRVQQMMYQVGCRHAGRVTEKSEPASRWLTLTGAEHTVAQLMGSGYSNKQIAGQLGVSPNTVGTHARSIFAKLQVRSRVQLSIQYHDEIVRANATPEDSLGARRN